MCTCTWWPEANGKNEKWVASGGIWNVHVHIHVYTCTCMYHMYSSSIKMYIYMYVNIHIYVYTYRYSQTSEDTPVTAVQNFLQATKLLHLVMTV